MDGQQITGRFGLRLLWCTLGTLLALSPGTALAQAGASTDACGQSSVQIDATWPDGSMCENQTQAPVGYDGWETQGWAYYCGGDSPHFFQDTNGIAWDNSCFTELEDEPLEDSSKEDATFTNWCVTSQSLTVTLACFNTGGPIQ